MLVPLRIEYTNFRLLKDATYNFQAGVIFIAGENKDVPHASSNMSGKTTLANGLTFVTHGCDLTGNNIMADCVSIGEKYCRVACLFYSEGYASYFLVVRERINDRAMMQSGDSQNSLAAYSVEAGAIDDDFSDMMQDGQIFYGAASQHQPTLDAWFGAQELFLSAHVFGTSAAEKPFACKSDREQKRLFDLLVENADLEHGLDAAQSELKFMQRCKIEAEAKLEIITGEIERAVQEKSTLVQQAKQRPKVDLSKRIQAAQANADEILRQSEAATALCASLRCDRADYGVTQRKEYENALQAILACQKSVAELRASLDELRKGKATCSTCGSKLPQAKIIERRRSLALRLGEAKTTLAFCEEARIAKEQEVAKLKTQSQKSSKEKLTKAEERLEDLRKSYLGILEVQRQLAEQQAEYNAARKFRVEALVQAKEKLARLQSEKKTYSSAIASLTNAVQRCTFWQHAFGPKGIRAFRLDMVTPELNEIAADYSDAVFGDGTALRYSTLKRTKAGSTSECFNVKLIDAHDREAPAISAGQAMRRDLIHTFSMVELARRLGKRTVDILILDEMFQAVDAMGIESIIRLLHIATKEIKTVMVIEHNDDLQAHFDNTVTVVRKKQCATIKV